LAYGYTIFCDDIRQEVGGKTSYIGVYRQTMFVSGEFPIVLPKIAMGFSYIQPVSAELGEVEIQIWFPGDADDQPSARGMLPYNKDQQIPLPDGAEQSDDTVCRMEGIIIFAPLILRGEGKIKVRAKRGDEITKLGTLFVRRAPD